MFYKLHSYQSSSNGQIYDIPVHSDTEIVSQPTKSVIPYTYLLATLSITCWTSNGKLESKGTSAVTDFCLL